MHIGKREIKLFVHRKTTIYVENLKECTKTKQNKTSETNSDYGKGATRLIYKIQSLF